MKTITKNCFRTIFKTFNKFLSILLIILLGVGFFAGIKNTSPDMKKTVNKYFKDTNMYDIKLMSTWGINNNDIDYLKENNYQVYASYSFDTIITDNNNTKNVVKIHSLNKESNINKLTLLEGKLPNNPDECIIEYNDNYAIGDTISINSENLKDQKLKIVGIIKSPLYISRERGTTNLLSGKINFFIYCLEENFKMDYYSELYLDLNDDLDLFSEEYDKLINSKTKELEIITKYLKDNRFTTEKNNAIKEVNEAKEKYESSKTNATSKINSAKKEIEINENNLSEAKKTLTNLNSNLDSLKSSLNDLSNKIISLENDKKNVELLIINKKANNLDTTSEENTLVEINNNIQIINTKRNLITNNISSLETNIKDLSNKINTGEKQIKKAKTDLNKAKTDLNKKLNDALTEINDAENKIENLESPKWYILNLNSNIGFVEYKQDSERIANVAKVFPIVFFVVAILICLTTMTRMVEEERSNIGLLKSLGYNNKSIVFKYFLYAFLATLIGSVLGVIIGFSIIPPIIYNMYSMMYTLGDFVNEFNVFYALLGSFIALICIVFATLYAIYKSLKENPASLLRPKSPKVGKRVLLEKITFIWKRLSFSRKVTVRNVFRYKKRLLMTIIGIAGCTGLIIAGFGLKDCITNMVPNQYQKIYNYQIEVTFENDSSKEEKLKDIETINNMTEVVNTLIANKESVEITNYKTNQSIQLIVPFENINDFIKLKNRITNKKYKLEDKIIISEKISKLLNLKVGNTLKLSASKDYDVQIGGITENYLMHYIYMSKDLYNSDNFNTLYVKTNNLNKEQENMLADKFKQLSTISILSFNSSTENVFADSMENFKSVALVLIISAGMLAFVVLYNLSNINISERKRELASIKVLGFYDTEVYRYVSRENVILTIIGMGLGIIFGKILTIYIIRTCELDITMFDPVISFICYFYSLLITLGFTILVNITTFLSLKKIKMVESLKSVE